MSETSPGPTVAVLGLGAMGVAIARAVATTGVPVRAWNRTPRTAAEHGLADVPTLTIADSPTAAADAADVVVVCVRDHTVARTVLRDLAPLAAGAVVVNVSTGTPSEAVETAREAAALGLAYVTGAVMVPTSLVGTDDCLVLYAGAQPDLARIAPLTRGLGGTSDLTGPDHAVPPALDLAMLDIYFTGMYAHLHATALGAAHGIEPQRFLPYARGIVDTLGLSLPDLTEAVVGRRYDGGEARLDMCLAFLEHIVATSNEVGIAPGPAEVVRAASARAALDHPAGIDWDVVAEDFLPSRTTAYRPE